MFAFVPNSDELTTALVYFLYSLILAFRACDHFEFWYQAKLISKYTSFISLVSYFLVSVYKICLLVAAKSVCWFALSNALDYALERENKLICTEKPFFEAVGLKKERGLI